MESLTAWNMRRNLSQLKFVQKGARRGSMAATLADAKEAKCHGARKCFASEVKSHTAWNTNHVVETDLEMHADMSSDEEMSVDAPKVSPARASVPAPTQ